LNIIYNIILFIE